jgi:hypothetical protein
MTSELPIEGGLRQFLPRCSGTSCPPLACRIFWTTSAYHWQTLGSPKRIHGEGVQPVPAASVADGLLMAFLVIVLILGGGGAA